MITKCIVAGTNANGEPDLFFVKVETTAEQLTRGEHYDAARAAAKADGYEEPFVAFDELDPAGTNMLPLFVWESASVVKV